MQTKTKQRKILDAAAKLGELPMLAWFAASYSAGRESVIMLSDRTLPIVPVVLWSTLGGHRDQADLSRLLAEMMCKSMRRQLGLVVTIEPALTSYEQMTALGVERWEEWQLMPVDAVCPHCGAVNWGPCCADNRGRK